MGSEMCIRDRVEETIVTRRENARQVTVPKAINYNGRQIATIYCTVTFTYGLPTGQPLVGARSYSISNIESGYSIGNISSSVTNGNPATITYSYTIYLNGVSKTRGSVFVHVDNSGNYN